MLKFPESYLLKLALSSFVFVACMFCIQYACNAESPMVYSRIMDIEGIGSIPYYAQNDPLWENMLYEPKKSGDRRTMKVGGCAPTAAAMAIARQLDSEELTALISHASDPERGFPFCSCSVNGYGHRGEHDFTVPSTSDDFSQYLPVIFASYATGNNERYIKLRREGRATSVALFETLAAAYGLQYRGYREWEDAYDALKNGCSVITTVTEGIFTKSSHILCIAGIADGFVYLQDPMMCESYPLDKKHLLEVVEPGLVRVPLEDIEKVKLYCFYAIWK